MLCLGACSPGHNTYSEFRNLSQEGWAYNDTLTFVPSLKDSINEGCLSIALRHNNNYHYSNLWIEVKHLINDSTSTCDTFNIKLADIYGKWYGTGIGANYQIEQNIIENLKIENGNSLVVRHIMRVDTLRDIEQIGLFFIPNATK